MSGPTAQISAPLAGRRVVLCIAGGIAAYKSVEVLRLLTQAGAEVQCAMTAAACEFVGPLTLQALSGHKVFTHLFDAEQEAEIGHIHIADRADLVIVAPATATTMAKFAAGGAGDVVSAVVLATRSPVLVAPSMNTNMWESEATQMNVERLRERSHFHMVGPDQGWLACKWVGAGRMAAPADILEAATRILSPQDFAGKRVLVTAGPTREPLDPIRYLSNRSTGKMGYAIATAAARRGADVILVSGPTALASPQGVLRVDVSTAVTMRDAVNAYRDEVDVIVMAAAVSDLRPATMAQQKLKKEGFGDAPSMAFSRNPDILMELGEWRSNGKPVLVGFAAETENVIDNARAKRAAKAVDLMVANDVADPNAGFAVDDNRVVIVTETCELPPYEGTKLAVAGHILDCVLGVGY